MNSTKWLLIIIIVLLIILNPLSSFVLFAVLLEALPYILKYAIIIFVIYAIIKFFKK